MKTSLFIKFYKAHKSAEKKLEALKHSRRLNKQKAWLALTSGFSRAGVYLLS